MHNEFLAPRRHAIFNSRSIHRAILAMSPTVIGLILFAAALRATCNADHLLQSIDSTFRDRRQEESGNCDRDVDVQAASRHRAAAAHGL